jgi:hypothetical protein
VTDVDFASLIVFLLLVGTATVPSVLAAVHAAHEEMKRGKDDGPTPF